MQEGITHVRNDEESGSYSERGITSSGRWVTPLRIEEVTKRVGVTARGVSHHRADG